MRLLPVESWADMFAPWKGKRIGYIRGEHGNVGDTLQEKAFWQLCKHFGQDVVWLGPVPEGREPWDWSLEDGKWDGQLHGNVDTLVCFGGGNMGLPGPSMRLRKRASRLGLPITILPNSWRAFEVVPNCIRYYMRESLSKCFAPTAVLMPDVGLGLDFDESIRATEPSIHLGVFLRNDKEALFADACTMNQGAAFGVIPKQAVDGYLQLAASYERIVTDALHFSIAGLMSGREVTLVPGRYHKNRGMYDCWLKDLGCHWAYDPRDVEGVS